MYAYWFGGAVLLFLVGYFGASPRLTILAGAAALIGLFAWLIPDAGVVMTAVLFAALAASALLSLRGLRRRAMAVRAERGRASEPAWVGLALGLAMADSAMHAVPMDDGGAGFGGGDVGSGFDGDIGGGFDGGGF